MEKGDLRRLSNMIIQKRRLFILGTGLLLIFLISTSQAYSEWFNNDWKYKKKIFIKHDKLICDLTEFPLLVKIKGDFLKSHCCINGNDILFTAQDGIKKLPHEIENYNNDTGELIAWVKIPEINAGKDTVLYIYFGNKSAKNQQDMLNVWKLDYKGVWHLNEYQGKLPDSTINQNHGKIKGEGIILGKEGIIWRGIFIGNNEKAYVSFGEESDANSKLNAGEKMTIELWFKYEDKGGIIKKLHGRPDYTGYFLDFRKDDELIFMSLEGDRNKQNRLTGNYTFAAGEWYYLVLTFDDSTDELRMYVNGEEIARGPAQFSIMGNNVDLQLGGGGWFTGKSIKGIIDEVRISNKILTEVEVMHTYSNITKPEDWIIIEKEIEEILQKP